MNGKRARQLRQLARVFFPDQETPDGKQPIAITRRRKYRSMKRDWNAFPAALRKSESARVEMRIARG
ncbi:MAG: hypothetical protein GY716_16065 [bacterium]|nr:hypothetical protein [bacterium]